MNTSEIVTLLAEDEPAIRKLVHLLLEREGHRLLLSTDGVEALQISRAYPGQIHLLVSNVATPKIGGDRLAATLLRERPGIRVLLMSGSPARAAVAREMNLTCLRKPFVLREFRDAVRGVMEGGLRCQAAG